MTTTSQQKIGRNTQRESVMRTLVRRYIHLAKKNMRQDGVNEDDLLEIKQDISSLRYELREDRKREIARSIGHLEGLKQDIVNALGSEPFSIQNDYVTESARKPFSVPVTIIADKDAADTANNNHRTSFVEQPPELVRSYSTASSRENFVPILRERGSRNSSDVCGRQMQQLYDEIKQLALASCVYETSDVKTDANKMDSENEKADGGGIFAILQRNIEEDMAKLIQKEMMSMQQKLLKNIADMMINQQTNNATNLSDNSTPPMTTTISSPQIGYSGQTLKDLSGRVDHFADSEVESLTASMHEQTRADFPDTSAFKRSSKSTKSYRSSSEVKK